MPARKRAAASGSLPAEPLATYNAKRDFAQTPEPGGRISDSPNAANPSFVIQMHRASRLHYDFRLEADGVLKSWAIPKGPSLDTREKRLAMMVEDHPFDYRDFEGIIPAGNYGAGEVVVWDRGTYTLLEGTDTTEQIAHGSLKFRLSGVKLHGAFALVHIKGRGGEANAWLLIKERDDTVDPAWKVEDHTESVLTGKTIRDLAADPSAPHWESRPAASRKRVAPAEPAIELPPAFEPMLATAVDAPFDDPAYLFEVKWDGYRALARIARDGTVELQSRGGLDFAPKFPEFAALGDAFAERPLVIDGEIVVLDGEGRASFEALQARLDRFGRRKPGSDAVFVVFDCCFGNGRDLREEPLERRKAILEALLTGRGPVMLSKHVVGQGVGLFDLAREQHIEGIVAKRADSPYRSRRSRDWLKIKTECRQEFVVCGWTEGRSGRKHLGGLILGVYETGTLRFVGTVGSGFSGKRLEETAARLAPLERPAAALDPVPKLETRAHWTEPALVAEVAFTEWTRDGHLRHPVFVALRDDRDPATIVRESPEPSGRARAGKR